MNISQRQVNTGLLALMTVGTLLVLLGQLVGGGDVFLTLSIVAGVVVFGVLLVLYVLGVEYARHAAVIIVTLLLIFGMPEPFLTERITLAIFIPPILALIMLGPAWVAGSAAAVLLGLIVQGRGQSVYADAQTIMLFIMVVGGMILARLVTDTAHRRAEENARQAEEARTRAEAQARDLSDANELMNEQLDQQSKLLELVATLETPVVPLATGMLLAPIVGHVDSRRAQALTTRLLHEASAQRAKLVVLDIAGVAVMDTSVAKALIHTVHALRLLGCEVVLSGISASVAMSLIHLGVNLDEVKTVRSPQEALAQYLSRSSVVESRTAVARLNDGVALN